MLESLSIKNDQRMHEKSIFRMIFLQGPLTKRQILEKMGGSLTTISRFLEALEEDGLVIQDESRGKAAGARPGLYAVNPGSLFNFGAFISPDTYGIGLCNAVGEVIDLRERLLEKDTHPEEVFNFFTAFINDSLRSGAADPPRVLGLGVASTGPIKKSKGLIFHSFHIQNPEWQIVPLKDVLGLKTGLPTIIDSITETALLGELIYGRVKPIESAAYLWLDRGIGYAVYSHGTLGIGNIDMSASVGHTVIDFKGELCRCGKRGCLETYAAIESISQRLRAAVGEAAERLTAPAKPSGLDILGRASRELELAGLIIKTFPKECAPVLEEISEALAVALSNFICITRPEIVFYSGRTAAQLAPLVEGAFARIGGMLNSDSFKDIRFVSSVLGNRQIVKGAALLSLNQRLDFVRNITR